MSPENCGVFWVLKEEALLGYVTYVHFVHLS